MGGEGPPGVDPNNKGIVTDERVGEAECQPQGSGAGQAGKAGTRALVLSGVQDTMALATGGSFQN